MNTLTIGITGPSASGKTSLAHTITHALRPAEVAIIAEDAYYKDRSHLTKAEQDSINYDHPSAFDHALLSQHLRALQAGQTIQTPQYDYSTHSRRSQTRTVAPQGIIIVEGILVFAEAALRDLMSIRIFVDTPLDVCLIRRLRRDSLERQRTFESILAQYEATVRPMYYQFVAPSRRYAHVVVPPDGDHQMALDAIKHHATDSTA